MSCGLCPSDRFDAGLSLRSRIALYTGTPQGGSYGGCGSKRPTSHSQNNAQTTYGKEHIKMKTYHPPYKQTTTYVPNIYTNAQVYIPPFRLETPENLEDRLSLKTPNTLEAKLEESPSDLHQEEHNLIYRAQTAEQKRRTLLKEIKNLQHQTT